MDQKLPELLRAFAGIRAARGKDVICDTLHEAADELDKQAAMLAALRLARSIMCGARSGHSESGNLNTAKFFDGAIDAADAAIKAAEGRG